MPLSVEMPNNAEITEIGLQVLILTIVFDAAAGDGAARFCSIDSRKDPRLLRWNRAL